MGVSRASERDFYGWLWGMGRILRGSCRLRGENSLRKKKPEKVEAHEGKVKSLLGKLQWHRAGEGGSVVKVGRDQILKDLDCRVPNFSAMASHALFGIGELT